MGVTLRQFQTHLEAYFEGLADLDRYAIASRAVVEVPWDLEFLMHGGEPGIEVTRVHPFRIASPGHPDEEAALAAGASVAEIDGDTGYDGVPNKDGQIVVCQAKAAAAGLELLCPTVAEDQAGYVSPGMIRVRYVPSADAVLDHASILRSYLAVRDSLRSAWQVAEANPEIVGQIRVDFSADLWVAWQLVPWEPSREVGDWTALLPLVDGYSAGPDFFDTRPEEEVMEELEALKPQWRYWASHDTPRYSFAVAPGAGDILRIGISGQCAQPVETLLAHLAQVGRLSPNAALWGLIIGHCEVCRQTGQHPNEQDRPNGCRKEYLAQVGFHVGEDFMSYDLSQDWEAHVETHTGLTCAMVEPEVCALDYCFHDDRPPGPGWVEGDDGTWTRWGPDREAISLEYHLRAHHRSVTEAMHHAYWQIGPGARAGDSDQVALDEDGWWEFWEAAAEAVHIPAFTRDALRNLGSPQHVTRLVRQQRTDEAKAAAQLAEDRFRTVWASLSEVARDHLKAACYHLTALDRGETEAVGTRAQRLGSLCVELCAAMESEWKRRVWEPYARLGGKSGRKGDEPTFGEQARELVLEVKLDLVIEPRGGDLEGLRRLLQDGKGCRTVRAGRDAHVHGGRDASPDWRQVEKACHRALSNKEEDNWLLEYFRALPLPPRD